MTSYVALGASALTLLLPLLVGARRPRTRRCPHCRKVLPTGNTTLAALRGGRPL